MINFGSIKVNIFSNLRKYSCAENENARDENYLTEAFVFLLRLLLGQEKQKGIELLNRICGDGKRFELNDKIFINTQVCFESDIFDIEIKSDNKRIIIEVKLDSDLSGEDQIEKYRKYLKKCKEAFKKLILLTKFQIDVKGEGPNNYVKWYQVYDWLQEMKCSEVVVEYFRKSFCEFLEEKGMSIKKVTDDYMNGIGSLINLLNVMEFVIEQERLNHRPPEMNKEYVGYYLKDKDLWPKDTWHFFGIYCNKPSEIVYEFGKSYETEGRQIFDLREDFFNLDKEAQLKRLTKFIKNCYMKYAKTVNV